MQSLLRRVCTRTTVFRSKKRSFCIRTAGAFAVFDFDNTCIIHDAGEACLAFLCKNRLLRDDSLLGVPFRGSRASYHEQVFRRYWEILDEEDVLPAYELAAAMFSGFSREEAEETARCAIEQEGRDIGKGELFGISIARGLAPRPAVLDLMSDLASRGTAVWIVSASPAPAVRAAMEAFGVSGSLIAMESIEKEGVFTRELRRPYSIAEGKVSCIRAYIHPSRRPMLAVGDSANDLAMIEYADRGAVVDRGSRMIGMARERGWIVLQG